MFETQKSRNKTSSGDIGLNIRTLASPKVGQDQVFGGVSVLCWHAAPWNLKKPCSIWDKRATHVPALDSLPEYILLQSHGKKCNTICQEWIEQYAFSMTHLPFNSRIKSSQMLLWPFHFHTVRVFHSVYQRDREEIWRSMNLFLRTDIYQFWIVLSNSLPNTIKRTGTESTCCCTMNTCFFFSCCFFFYFMK